MKQFKVTIDNFHGGFAPAWYNNTYPSYGNKNMAGDMRNVELADFSYLTQGAGLEDYPGFQGYKVLVKAISEHALTTNNVLAIANASAQSIIFETSSVTANAYAYAITAGTNPTGSDVCVWTLSDGNTAGFYSWYNAVSANVGSYLSGVRDDDWLTTYVSGTLSAQVPLPLEPAGDQKLYIGTGSKVSSVYWNGSSYDWVSNGLVLQKQTVVQDIKWCNDQLYVAANRPDVSNNNITRGAVYIWGGTPTLPNQEIIVGGKVGALFVDKGTVYVFYRDLTDINSGYKMGYISGLNIIDLCAFKGGLPLIGQVCKHKGFIKWVGGEYVWAYGSPDGKSAPMLYQCNDGGLTTVGALAAPFGTLLVASQTDATYQLSKCTGYETNSYWKSMMFPVGRCTVQSLVVYVEPLTAGARADFSLTYDNGNITNAKEMAITETGIVRKEFDIGQRIDNNFRVEIDFSSGSATYPVKINRIEVIILRDND